jgi:hypothetical protein
MPTGNTHLTLAQVGAIRFLLAKGELMAAFGTRPATASRIRNLTSAPTCLR